jgi:DnaJ-class molecular chaperone
MENEIEEDEDEICSWCSGSGEGMYDGSTCQKCKGSGVEPVEKDEDDCYGID